MSADISNGVYTKDHQTFFVREKSEFYEKFEEEVSTKPCATSR